MPHISPEDILRSDTSGMDLPSVTNISNLMPQEWCFLDYEKMLSDEVEDPVIKPVLDLSNITSGAKALNNMFSTSQVMSASASMSALQNEQLNGARLGTTFIQNNYSPKALSRTEIYRQTKNQFSAYREAML